MNTYTNRYKYRTTKQTSDNSKYVTWGLILAFAILWNILAETQLYHNIIVALS